MTNNVNSYTTAINNNFAAIKATLNNISAGSVYATTNPSAITPSNGVGTWTVTHNLNTSNVRADLYQGGSEIIKNVTIDSANAVTFTFIANTTVAKDSLKTIIMGV